jgi:hypothetical protein
LAIFLKNLLVTLVIDEGTKLNITDNQVIGHISGFARKFWHGNTTHRGTDEKVLFYFSTFYHRPLFSTTAVFWPASDAITLKQPLPLD